MNQSILYGLLCSLIAVLGALLYSRRLKREIKTLKSEQDVIEQKFREKELKNCLALLAQKNMLLEELRIEVKKADETIAKQKLLSKIELQLKDDSRWKKFTSDFEQINHNFMKAVQAKYKGISSKEMRLMALIRMNQRNPDIASLLNISQSGIKKARFRLRKKLELNTTESLEDTIKNIA